MRRLLLPLLALVVLAGCGSSSNSSSSSSGGSAGSSGSASASSSAGSSGAASASGGTTSVTIKNFAFNPKALHAKVGETIQWTNQDSAPHNVVHTAGPAFASSSTLSTGDKFTLKLTKPGTISYICSIHPFMKATIVVAP
jgi:plastocyanin